jgi:transcriptional regulator with XRE-family HTH domain
MDGSKLYNRRKELGLTLEEVGDIVGVSKSTVRKWETGYIENMKRDKIALLAKALQTTPLYIMGIKDVVVSEEPISFTKSEKELVHKYRNIDDKGKHTVDTVLEMEYIRCNKPHLIVNAAHTIEGSTEEGKRHDDELMNNDKLWDK